MSRFHGFNHKLAQILKMSVFNTYKTLSRLLSAFAVLSGLSIPSLPAFADTIEAKLPKGIIVTAGFHMGRPSQPAILLLHGFLQTHHSQPMISLASNLASKGYTTLNPTISLGINKRSQSMPCEAVHTHTAEEDIAEISYWVNWLIKKGHKNIVLAGFSSTGNFEILSYTAQSVHPAIKNVILVSPNPIFSVQADLQKTRLALKSNKNKDANRPELYSLGYCLNNFAATTNSYLSYAVYDENKVLELIEKTTSPTEIIIGTADTILPKNWAARIKALNSPAHVNIVENANHFFDGISEFDLVEKVESILKKVPAK